MASGRCGRPALGEVARDGNPNGLRPQLDDPARLKSTTRPGPRFAFRRNPLSRPGASDHRPPCRAPPHPAANVFKISDGVFREGVAVRYAFIERHRTVWPIARQCQVLKVSTSGYRQYRVRRGDSSAGKSRRRLRVVLKPRSRQPGDGNPYERWRRLQHPDRGRREEQDDRRDQPGGGHGPTGTRSCGNSLRRHICDRCRDLGTPGSSQCWRRAANWLTWLPLSLVTGLQVALTDDGGADWGGHPYLEPDWSSATRKDFTRFPLRR